jgi:hypothetical protein
MDTILHLSCRQGSWLPPVNYLYLKNNRYSYSLLFPYTEQFTTSLPPDLSLYTEPCVSFHTGQTGQILTVQMASIISVLRRQRERKDMRCATAADYMTGSIVHGFTYQAVPIIYGIYAIHPACISGQDHGGFHWTSCMMLLL